MNNIKAIQEKVANTVCNTVEQQFQGWECLIPLLGEPKMPVELVLEDAE